MYHCKKNELSMPTSGDILLVVFEGRRSRRRPRFGNMAVHYGFVKKCLLPIPMPALEHKDCSPELGVEFL